MSRVQDSSNGFLARERSLPGMLGKVEPLQARRFVIAIRRLADDLTYGLDGSRYLGSGIDYVQSRAYLDGDPVKSMDWRVTARTGKYFVKEYEAQRRIAAWLLIDTSASMVVSSTRISKYELALHIAGGVALACLDRTSPVGVIGTGEREVRIEPSLAKDQVLQWLYRLRRYAFHERTTLVRRIAELRSRLTGRALVIVLSDLHEPGAVQALAMLAQQHEVAVLQLQDPAECMVAGAGFLRAQDAETGQPLLTSPRKRLVDPARMEADLRKAGVESLRIRTDESFLHRLRHFLRHRGLLGKGAR